MSFWKIRFGRFVMDPGNYLIYRNKVLRFGMSGMSGLI